MNTRILSKALLMAASLTALTPVASSQVLYHFLGTELYDSFDSLPRAGTSFNWADNLTLPGWYVANTTSNSFNPAGISTGSSTTGRLYSFGNSGSSDRALGTLNSSAVGGIYLGKRIINNTGSTIHVFRVSYTGEQWRSSAAGAQAMTFSFGHNATGLTTGTFSEMPGLVFTSPVTGGTAGSLDGNLTPNRTAVGPIFLVNLNWRHGEELWLRWFDPDHAGTDHGLAIDDVTFTGYSNDSDNDQMTDIWEQSNGLNPNLASDAIVDADSDGLSNQEEFWIGSDPHVTASPLVIHVNKNSASSVEAGSVANPFKSIQAAIDAADATAIQVIRVGPGTYPERPYLNNKANVHLFSSSGPRYTVIDGQFVNSSVVRLYDFAKTTLCGFTIRNAQTDWSGGGVRVISTGAIRLTNNIITNNHSSTTDSSGGGGGLYLETGDSSFVANNLIFGNSARRGGGVLFKAGKTDFYHNTVADNTANGDGLGGGASAILGLVPDVKNNIFWGNSGSAGLENLHQIQVSHCIVANGAAGAGNTAADPEFIQPSNGNYHLKAISPAIGAGYPLPVLNDLDRDERARTLSSRNDLGADQYVTGTTTDSDSDGMPDWWETLYGLNPGNASDANGDLVGDGVSNLVKYITGRNPLVEAVTDSTGILGFEVHTPLE